MSEIKPPIHLSAGGGTGGSASRFGIEDNTSDVDRIVDLQGHSLYLQNGSYYEFDAQGSGDAYAGLFISNNNGGVGTGTAQLAAGIVTLLSVDYNGIRFRNINSQEFFIPNITTTDGTPKAIPLTVNGQFADATGNITISSTGGGGGGDMLLANYIVDETLSGTVNGTNTVFTFANAVVTNKEMIFLNGAKQRRGVDYIMTNSTTATFTTAPTADGGTDYLDATYFKQ